MASIPDGEPLTGKPDAGDPPVRFGGRGKVNATFVMEIHYMFHLTVSGITDLKQ